MCQGRIPRSRRIDATRRGGYTLIEVLLATLIACVMVTTVFSVSLTVRRDSTHNDRRLVANQIARTVTARLANYVSACCNDTGCDGAGTSPVCTLPGPNSSNPSNRWSFTDSNDKIYDSCGGAVGAIGNCYAFQLGIHRIWGTGVIPDYFAAAPYNAYIEYTVGSFGATSAPNLTEPVTVKWTEPSDK